MGSAASLVKASQGPRALPAEEVARSMATTGAQVAGHESAKSLPKQKEDQASGAPLVSSGATLVQDDNEDEDPALDPGGEEEAFYQAHRDELLEMLRGGQAKLQPRSEGGVGLLNQGATCYMNSLLQSLFNIPEFRMALYQFEHNPELHGEASRCIPLQLQRLFAELQLSQASATSTKELTMACGFSGRDAMEQHDVQELCRVLFDALERSSSMLAEVIRDLYSGTMTNYTRCKEERDGQVYESRRPATFMDLQVPIQDCKSLEEALKQLVQPTLLSGDNQWLCEDLGEKVDALSGMSIDALPKILCLQLLRFVFDVQLMRRKKLTDSLAIPLELDAGCLGGSGNYQLSAVCLHSGTAHGGHYHAFIHDLHSGVWKDANDSRVQLLGQRQCEALFASENGRSVLHSSDAYFLLYRRIGMSAPTMQDMTVPSHLSQALSAENQRLKTLQRVYELHRRLLEVKVHAPSSKHQLQRRFMAQQLSGLVPEEEPCTEESVSFSTLDRRPQQLLDRALTSLLSTLDSERAKNLQQLEPTLRTARLRYFDPLRGVAKGLYTDTGDNKKGGYSCGKVELILDEGAEESLGEVLLLVHWGQEDTLSLQQTAAFAWSKVAEDDTSCKVPETKIDPDDEEEQPDIFGSEMPVRSSPASLQLRDVRLAAAKRWMLPLEATALVALTGMQAGQELEEDPATLRECGLSPDDIVCVELRKPGAPLRAKQLWDRQRNTAKMFFNHPDRPDSTEEFEAIAISKDASLLELKVQIAEILQLAAAEIHLAKSAHATAMFKDEARTVRQAGFGDVDTVFVGHGAPCNPDESLLKVLRYTYDNGNHKVSDGFTFPARGEMSVRSLKEGLAPVCLDRWALGEVTWNRLRLRDGQAGKQHAILRDQRTLRSALLGFSDGRQVAVQVMEEEEELGPEDMLLLVRPWRVMEARLHAPTEMVVSKNLTLREFRAKLTDKYKGLLQDAEDAEDDKENHPEGLEKDTLEIIAAHATGPPMTVKRCETLKWSESRLSGEGTQSLADLKELRDGVTLIVRSKVAASKGAQVENKTVKGTGKGPSSKGQAGRKAVGQQPTVTVATAKSRAERGLVIQVAHPEAELAFQPEAAQHQ